MDKKKRDRAFYKLALGSLGMLLVAIGLVKNLSLYHDTRNIALIGTGFFMMADYLNSLEKKAEVSEKLMWIRAGAIGFALLLCAFIMF